MERVCERMKDYGETSDPATDRTVYVRFMAREGASPDISNVSYNTRVTADLKFAVRIPTSALRGFFQPKRLLFLFFILITLFHDSYSLL